MIRRFSARLLLLLLSGSALQTLSFATSPASLDPEQVIYAENAARCTNALHEIMPGPDDGRIAWITAELLEQSQYLRKPFDRSVSTNFFVHYLDSLDPQRMHFLQSDVAEFDHYRTNLNRMTLRGSQDADTRAGFEIFNRFLLRLQQRVNYADDLLAHEKFTFDTDERIMLNRKDQPYPADLTEAQRLWKERVRYEYLQEKLGKLAARKKTETAPKSAPPASGEKPKAPAAKPADEAREIADLLTHRYQRLFRTYADLNNDDVVQQYLGALSRIYDPHSEYMGHAQLEQFSISMNLSLFGIGAQLHSSEDGFCVIDRLLAGGPALKSKELHEQDRIIAVAQSNQPPVDILGMNLNKAVQLIRGPKGTEVRLTILPAGADNAARKVVPLIRDEIPLEDAAAKARLIELPDPHGGNFRLGYINLPSFYAYFDPSNTRDKSTIKSSTSADVATLLRKLEQEHVKGVILDLRGNGGGSLEEAIRVVGLFIKTGPVVQVKDFRGDVQVEKDDDPTVVYDGPLVVMTSRFSASASEIVAAALQDYNRALLVGDISTHGKGTVQAVNYLAQWMRKGDTNDPGALKVTIKKFYRASGVSTQKRGVLPDIVLPSVANESKDIGESALDSALECDSINPAKYEPLGLVEPYLAELRAHSAERVAKDPEFTYVREDGEQLKKAQTDKTVSLNEKERIKENEINEAREKARNAERRTRKPVQETVYELPLKLAAQPGLPPPVGHTNSDSAAASPQKGVKFTFTNATTVSALTSRSNNLVAAATNGAAKPASDDADEPKPPSVDETLQETEHILVDYIGALHRPNVAKAEHEAAATRE